MGLVENVVKFAKGLMFSSQSKKMVPEIPSELQMEILKRLPFKSLARFKCVSKLWYSLIHSLGHLFPSPPRLYLTSGLGHNHDYDIMDEVCPEPAKPDLLSFSFTSTSKSSAVFDLDLTKQGIGGKGMVVLRGLLLNTVGGQAFIYNPTTGQRVSLPAIKFKMDNENCIKKLEYFLGYDPVLDQYKVLCTAMVISLISSNIHAQHWWVFVMKAGSFWKKIEFDHLHWPSLGFCINGVVYYLADPYMDGSFVISFDVRSEEFRMIQAPVVVNFNNWHTWQWLIECDGKPTIIDYTQLNDPSGLLNLWVLEDAEKWSMKSLVLQPCLKHFFPDSIGDFQVLGTTKNGEVIMAPEGVYLEPEEMTSPYYIVYYDLHKNNVTKVDIRVIPKETFEVALMDIGENIMHLKI